MSSAYCENLNSLSKTIIPLMVLSCRIALANISAQSTKSAPESGHPYRTPRSILKNSEAYPLFMTQLEQFV